METFLNESRTSILLFPLQRCFSLEDFEFSPFRITHRSIVSCWPGFAAFQASSYRSFKSHYSKIISSATPKFPVYHRSVNPDHAQPNRLPCPQLPCTYRIQGVQRYRVQTLGARDVRRNSAFVHFLSTGLPLLFRCYFRALTGAINRGRINASHKRQEFAFSRAIERETSSPPFTVHHPTLPPRYYLSPRRSCYISPEPPVVTVRAGSAFCISRFGRCI